VKVTVKGFLHASEGVSEGDTWFTLFNCDMSECGYVPVVEREFEIEIPDDFDLNKGRIAALEKEKTRIGGEYHARVTKINEQISKLTALEFNPS
jgi:hypothetical protein